MQPLRIIEIIDGACDGLHDVLTRAPNLSPQEFRFQGLEEALRDRIVPAVSLSAHGHDKAMGGKELHFQGARQTHAPEPIIIASSVFI
ncbi:hypothetical protein AD949_08470 [Acetobacter orleanensis]|nr:hypothetical protein AD949_08470 [Acetobacter orleanensis]